MSNINHLKSERAEIIAEMRGMLESGRTVEFDAAGKKITELDLAINREERMAQLDTAASAATYTPKVEAREYSILRALNGFVNNGRLDGLEAEISKSLAANSGTETRGFRIPLSALEQRAEIKTSANIADQKFGPFIPRLVADSVILKAGATVLDGLGYGKVVLPRQTGGADANIAWLAESGSAALGDATFDSISLAPHTCGVYQKISRRALLTESIGLEEIVRADTAAAVGRAIDIAALGASATNAPTGIRGLLTENATTETAIDLAAADLLTSIEALNGSADTFIVSNAVLAAARKKRTTDGLPIPLATQFYDKNVVGSNLLTGTTIIAVKASDLLVGFFNKAGTASVDVVVDTSTYSSEGALKIAFFSDVDFNLKNAGGSAQWVTIGS
ncbi:phage major capsid protein [Rhizobium rhizogenes]|uniref:phage major capsid protein n=1 Tax=Rhizobium rhizogenes TaxID=359 RepID=UPI001AAF7751|nr:phage major capsid protein [Rhizobium rhizogenes]QTG05493.1 phage major capsid protein [Rhizobium rhizogenes]